MRWGRLVYPGLLGGPFAENVRCMTKPNTVAQAGVPKGTGRAGVARKTGRAFTLMCKLPRR